MVEDTKNNFIEIGSIIFLLIDSNVSKGGLVSARVIPSPRMNLRIASGIKPLCCKAISVGKRGSSHDEMIPPSSKGLIFLLETGIPSNSNLENSMSIGLLILSFDKRE